MFIHVHVNMDKDNQYMSGKQDQLTVNAHNWAAEFVRLPRSINLAPGSSPERQATGADPDPRRWGAGTGGVRTKRYTVSLHQYDSCGKMCRGAGRFNASFIAEE